MKKLLVKSLILVGMFLAITGCDNGETGPSQPGTSSEPTSQEGSSGQGTSQSGGETSSQIPVGEQITVYLDLGEIGRYDGQPGTEYPEVNLLYGVKLETTVGAALPGADKVSATSGATFSGWMIYEGNGAPTKYETVPGYANCILLPNFTGGSGGSGEGGEPVDPGEGINVTINISIPSGWSMSTIRDAGAVIFVYAFEGEYSAPTWLSTTGEGNTVNVTFDKAPGQFIVVRCAAGTTTGNWDAKWNQTGNITYRASGTSYSAELQ